MTLLCAHDPTEPSARNPPHRPPQVELLPPSVQRPGSCAWKFNVPPQLHTRAGLEPGSESKAHGLERQVPRPKHTHGSNLDGGGRRAGVEEEPWPTVLGAGVGPRSMDRQRPRQCGTGTQWTIIQSLKRREFCCLPQHGSALKERSAK